MLQFQSGNTFVADVVLCNGKFYMEISVLEIDSVAQFGFFTEGFFSREPPLGVFKGAGDDALSWAVDGTRQVKCFTGAKTEFGTKWMNGDVVSHSWPSALVVLSTQVIITFVVQSPAFSRSVLLLMRAPSGPVCSTCRSMAISTSQTERHS